MMAFLMICLLHIFYETSNLPAPSSFIPTPPTLQDKDGKPTDWGNVPYSKVYGEDGWCNADNPQGDKK